MANVYIVVTPFFPSQDDWRGAYCLDFVRSLRKARAEMRIEVFVPGIGEGYEIEGVRVHRFQVWQLPSNILPFLFRRQNENSFLRAVTGAGVSIDDIAFCHAHTANFVVYPIALKKLNAHVKTLLHHHDLASYGLNLGILHRCSLYNVWLFRKLRALHEQIDCHVFISEASRRSFLAAPDAEWSLYDDYKTQMKGPKTFRCRPAKIKGSVILHNGVDTGIFKPLKVWNGRKRFVIGCIGNFIDLKDQMTLLKAMEIIGSGVVKAVFIGSGPERMTCEKYARENGIAAEFRAEVRHERLPAFYREIDLFVLPSYFEGFGCVFTEAWACGVPFITCEGQGMDDMIYDEDRDLWLCKPRDAKDFAAKIKNFIENRPAQRLKAEIDIYKLVSGFIKDVEEIRRDLLLA